MTGALRPVVGTAAVSALGVVAAFAIEPRRAAASFLFAFVWLASLVFGSLIFLAIAHTTGAGWMVVLRRRAEDIAGVTPWLVALFVPVALTAHLVFPWAMPPESLSATMRDAIGAKHGYLALPFMAARGVVALASWTLVAQALRTASNEQDASADRALVARQRRISAATLPWLAFTVTFGAFDWVMSLDPTWSSNVLGIYLFAGGFGASCGVVALLSLGAFPSRITIATAQHGYALGRLLFTFVIFWAYIAFTQYLIVWIADVPREVPWVARRTTGAWAWVALVLVIVHFALPFGIFLSRALKLEARWVAVLGAWLACAHAVDVYWLVIPEITVHAVPSWTDVAALLFVASSALLVGVVRASAAEVPLADPRLARGLAYEARP